MSTERSPTLALIFDGAVLAAERPGLKEFDEFRQQLRDDGDRERADRHRFHRLAARRRAAGRLKM